MIRSLRFGEYLLAVTGISLAISVFGGVLAEEDHAEELESGEVVLDAEARKAAGVATERVDLRSLRRTVVLPAEVIINKYRAAKVAPKIPSVIEARYVKLGDVVQEGQPLVRLSSVEMAEAAGELMLATYEWKLVQELGEDAVSGRRIAAAQIAHTKAMAKVLAYGLTQEQALELAHSRDAQASSGVFDLLALRTGTVFSDDFVVGELADAGRTLIEIVDEESVWVEAHAVDLPHVEQDTSVTVINNDGLRLIGRVVQLHHRLDESTRTRALRIEVENVKDNLHPGQFVQVEIASGPAERMLAIPRNAVTLIEGRESVFLAEGNEFHPASIKSGEHLGDWIIVLGGLEVGDSIATTGVFHLKSLLLKSSLGSGHAH